MRRKNVDREFLLLPTARTNSNLTFLFSVLLNTQIFTVPSSFLVTVSPRRRSELRRDSASLLAMLLFVVTVLLFFRRSFAFSFSSLLHRSARLSFVFDQIDAIEKECSQKHETLQRIRAWRKSKNTQNDTPETVLEPTTSSPHENPNTVESKPELTKKEVELVHLWPEWIQLMERMVHQNYFDHRRMDEDKMVQDLGFKPPEVSDDAGLDITKDFKSVHAACLNFGKNCFDLLRSLSRQDIQILVGFGCPNVDRKVVFSAKLLRKHVHLDEGDVSS